MKVYKFVPIMLAGILGVQARAEDLSFGIKFRGIKGTSAKDGVNNGLGFGLNVDIPFPLVKDSSLSAELGYRYLTGDGYRVPVSDPAHVYNNVNSLNWQKTNVQGFSARVAFSMPIPAIEDLRWQAGLNLADLKSRMDAVGDFRTGDGTDEAAQTGSWAMSPEKAGICISPFAGVVYNFNTAGGLELNLILESYKQVTLTPAMSATAVTPVLGSKSVSTLKIEVGYIFRF